MSEYYDRGTMIPHTTARAEAVNNETAKILAGFEMLPAVAALRKVAQVAVAAGGTGNALTVTNAYAITSYGLGQTIAFQAASANTGPATVNVDGVGVKSLLRADGVALVANDLLAGRIYAATYDGTAFQLSSVIGLQDYVDDAETAKVAAQAAQAAAEAAETNAETARTGAETAETNAELAETNAETARDAALAAQAAAEAASLPSQTGHSGKVLTTNGSVASWGSSAWAQIGSTVATTSGATATFSNIPQTYTDLLFLIEGVSTSGTSNILIDISTDGSTWYGTTWFYAPASAAAVWDGAVAFINYTADYGAAVGGANVSTNGLVIAATNDVTAGHFKLVGGLKHIRLRTQAGSFDAGLVRLKGRP